MGAPGSLLRERRVIPRCPAYCNDLYIRLPYGCCTADGSRGSPLYSTAEVSCTAHRCTAVRQKGKLSNMQSVPRRSAGTWIVAAFRAEFIDRSVRRMPGGREERGAGAGLGSERGGVAGRGGGRQPTGVALLPSPPTSPMHVWSRDLPIRVERSPRRGSMSENRISLSMAAASSGTTQPPQATCIKSSSTQCFEARYALQSPDTLVDNQHALFLTDTAAWLCHSENYASRTGIFLFPAIARTGVARQPPSTDSPD